jgi:hypothetical protein
MRHVSAETMARFRQGDLNGRRSTQVSTHLAGCDRCSARSADLGRVTTLLASAPQPRMPDEVTGRIRAALAAEAAVRAAGSGAKVPARGPRAWRPRLPHPSHRVALRGLAAAAAVALLAGGGYAIVTATGASSTSTHAASGPAGEARPAVGVPGSGNGLMVPAHASGPTLQYRHDGHEADITPVATGTDFTRAGLAGQATSAVARYGAGSVVTRPNAAGPSHTAAVSGVAGAGERPHPGVDAPGLRQPHRRGK